MEGPIETCKISPKTMNGLIDFTVTLWINLLKFQNSKTTIFSVANNLSDNLIMINHNSIIFQNRVGTPASNERCDFSDIDTLGTWYHVAITRHTLSKAFKFYYNGV